MCCLFCWRDRMKLMKCIHLDLCIKMKYYKIQYNIINTTRSFNFSGFSQQWNWCDGVVRLAVALCSKWSCKLGSGYLHWASICLFLFRLTLVLWEKALKLYGQYDVTLHIWMHYTKKSMIPVPNGALGVPFPSMYLYSLHPHLHPHPPTKCGLINSSLPWDTAGLVTMAANSQSFPLSCVYVQCEHILTHLAAMWEACPWVREHSQAQLGKGPPVNRFSASHFETTQPV